VFSFIEWFGKFLPRVIHGTADMQTLMIINQPIYNVHCKEVTNRTQNYNVQPVSATQPTRQSPRARVEDHGLHKVPDALSTLS
jgi:hypothetical protein